MSYTRERKVTSIVKDVLVWIPAGSEITTDMEEADSASLAEAGLCSAEELRRLRSELQAAMCEIDRLHVFEQNAESAEAERERCCDVVRRTLVANSVPTCVINAVRFAIRDGNPVAPPEYAVPRAVMEKRIDDAVYAERAACANIAINSQRTDQPEPWNDACLHIEQLILARGAK